MTADAVGGVWTYAIELADALEPHGVEVHLATMGPAPNDEQRAAASRSALVSLHESSFALEWESDPWDDVRAAGEWLLALGSAIGADLVHLNGYAHASLEWDVPVAVVAHSDVVSWWRAVHGIDAPAAAESYRAAVEEGLDNADVVVAPTRAVLHDLSTSYRFETPSFVVPNGRRQAAVAAEKEPLVVGLGRFWDEAKNVAVLERLKPRAPWPVVVAGAGTPRGPLPEPEVRELLARASVFAAPARYEPFGLAVLEAAQAGCALVLGDIASLHEVWGDAAWYVPPDDEEALLAALQVIARDPLRRQELGRRASERAVRYSPAAMAEGMLAVYEPLLARVAGVAG
jgi:glycogen synthase